MPGKNKNNPQRALDPHRVGCIRLARILEMRPRTFIRLVEDLEASSLFTEMRVQVAHLVTPTGDDNGVVNSDRGRPVAWFDRQAAFQYMSDVFSRYYSTGTILQDTGQNPDSQQVRFQQQLRAINSRNLLTLALLRTLAHRQRDYLISGDPQRRHSVTLDELAASINADPACPILADGSRLSRLMRHLLVGTSSGEILPISTLCPRPRELHRHYVDAIVRAEQRELLNAVDATPFSDETIAQAVLSQFGVLLSRRTVSSIRRDLGIPCSRRRGKNSGYAGATHGFSVLQPLKRQIVRSSAPTIGGIYELHARPQPTVPANVIYIGSAGDLRKRLMDHLRGAGTNTCLTEHVASGEVWFRYRPIMQRWRESERRLYQAYRDSFGSRPACNRMSP